MGDDEYTRTGDGRPKYCVQCGQPYRERQRVPGLVNQCPTGIEAKLNWN